MDLLVAAMAMLSLTASAVSLFWSMKTLAFNTVFQTNVAQQVEDAHQALTTANQDIDKLLPELKQAVELALLIQEQKERIDLLEFSSKTVNRGQRQF